MTSALELLPAQDLAGGSAPNRRERKAATFAACAAICGRSSRMFFHWQRLAGEGRLVQEQILRCQHTRVRWHHVACRQPDDVSRNEDAKRHLLLAAVAELGARSPETHARALGAQAEAAERAAHEIGRAHV